MKKSDVNGKNLQWTYWKIFLIVLCGKSYLLNEIFVNHLKESGVKEDHIIKLALDREENKKYHDSKLLNEYIHSNIKDKNMHYVILDEIQLVEGFEFVLNGLLYEKNIFRLLKNIILQILVYVMLDWILDNKRKIISWKTSYISDISKITNEEKLN